VGIATAALIAAPLVVASAGAAAAADPTTTALVSADFEDGTLGGLVNDGSSTSAVETVDGNKVVHVAGRSHDYDGIQTADGALSSVKPGDKLQLSAKVRLVGPTDLTTQMRLVVKPAYGWVGNTTVTDDGWATLSGSYTVPDGTDPAQLGVYVGTADLTDGATPPTTQATYDYYVDDVSIALVVPPVSTCTPSDPTALVSADFEDGTLGGLVNDGSSTSAVETVDGNKVVHVAGRSHDYDGIQTADGALSSLKPGDKLQLSAKVRLVGPTDLTTQMRLVVKPAYGWVGNTTVTDDGWATLSGSYTVPDGTDPAQLGVYVGTADLTDGATPPTTHATYDYDVDDVSIVVPGVTCDTPPTGPTCDYPTTDPVISADFESGIGDWTARADGNGAGTLAVVEGGHDSDHALEVTDRTSQGQGPGYDVTCILETGQTYQFSGWVKFGAGQPTDGVTLSIATTTDGSTSYSNLVQFPATDMSNTAWVHVQGKFTMPAADSALVYLETKYASGAAGNTSDLYFDDLSFTKVVANVQDITPIKDTLSFPVGAAVSSAQLVGAAGQLLDKHFDQVTPENTMKPEGWYDADHEFKTTNADADTLMQYAQDNHLRVYGHTLVWYQQTPDWFFQGADGSFLTSSTADQAIMRDRLKTHIDDVARYLSDKFGKFGSATNPLVSFDVVNEVVSDNAGDPEGLRQSHWYQILGESYIEDAFTYANEAFNDTYAADGVDHPVALFINDYNTEQAGKRGRLLDLVNRLIADGVPVDGVGHQFHVTMSTPLSSLKDAIDAFNGIETADGHGLYQAVTELDVPTGTPVTEANLIDQGYYYRGIFDMLRAEAAGGAHIFSATVWGLLDGQSWRASSGAPLLFDDDLQAKYAYYGVTDQDLPAQVRTAIVFQGDVTGTGQTSSVEWSKLPLHPIGDHAGFQLRWAADHLTAYVSVDDATSDATDAVRLSYGDGLVATVGRDGTVTGTGVTADVSSTASGWKVVAHLPEATALTQGGSTQFDAAVTDGSTVTGWNTAGSLGTLQLVEPLSYTEIPEADTAPTIDGDRDAVWDSASTVTTTKRISGATDGATATVYQLWKGSYLYVLADVTDPTVDSTSPNAYERDSVEIFTDPGNAKNGSYRPDDMQIRIGANGDVSYGGGDSETAQAARLQSTAKIGGHGYVVEARIDLKDGNTGVGAFEGLDYEVNDGTAGARTANFGWAEQTGSAYQTTSRWGVAQLVAARSVVPVVVTQPASATAALGASAAFTAGASGYPVPTVRWQSKAPGASAWSDVPGATATSLTVVASAANDGTAYRAVFTNAAGSATSGSATLTVKHAAPSITTQPRSVAGTLGATVTLTAAAAGYPTPKVQWQSKAKGASAWSNVSGATATSLEVRATAASDGTAYRAVFTNDAGSATSSAATVTVKPVLPKVTTQPRSSTVKLGATATFTSAASGYPTPKVTWQRQLKGAVVWTTVPGTSTTLKVTATAGVDGARYRAVFTNTAGTTASSAATLSITKVRPVVTTQPRSASGALASTVTFTAKASGYPTPTVLWQRQLKGARSWTTLPGQRSTSLKVTVTSGVNGARYRAVFVNAVGTTYSSSATLTVKAAKPTITGQPRSVTVKAGKVASFHVSAVAYPSASYRWFVWVPGAKHWVPAINGRSSTLYVTASKARDGWLVRVVVSNAKGSVTSSNTALHVTR
jgi:endo-1,4-beta-xylanase